MDSFVISITVLETLKNSKPHSDLMIKLKFISDDTAQMIYEKLHDRILKFNQRVVDLLYKLDVKIENNKQVFPSSQSNDYIAINNVILCLIRNIFLLKLRKILKLFLKLFRSMSNNVR